MRLGHKDFRGSISIEISESNPISILEKVTKINEEIDKIQSSQRLVFSKFLYKLSMSVPDILSKILTGGNYGPEGIFQKSIQSLRSDQVEKIKNQVLSKFFGVSNAGINIWEIQQRLQK